MNSKKIISKKTGIILIVLSIFVAILLLFSVIFSIINIGNSKTINGIKIQGIDISNLSKEELTNKINEWKENIIASEINLKYKEIEESISIQELNLEINIEEAIEKACKIGKEGNIIENNYEILFTMLFGKNIDVNINIDEEKLNKKIEELSGKLPGILIESNYYIEESNLIIKKGKEGIKVKNKELIEKIKKEIKQANRQLITIPVENAKPQTINIEKIQQEIYKEPQDAYVEKEPIKVHPHINGVDFAISIEQAKEILKEEKEEYIIPLKITIPEKTIDNLGEEAFPSKLAEFVTRYDISNKNRSNNLEIASKKIDGTIILPGEIFSYNKIVGERTIAEGYKEAAIYSGGKVIDGIGGGICQLSSTLYNTVIYANLEIVSRTNHRFSTSYVTEGRDATVSWGTIDFQFKNTRTYPIKIVSTVRNGIVRVEIYGIEEEKEYEVQIESDITEVIPYTINYIDDNELEKGTEIVEQQGFNGAKSVTYKVVKYNGILISKTLLSNDTYSPMEKIIRRGTKGITKQEATNVIE